MESKIRIGLLVDYLESEYSESLIKGVSTFCKTKGISLYIFFVGEIKNVDTTFNYQYVASASFVTQNNLDGVVIASGGQFHSFTKEEFVSYLKKYFSLPLVNISSQLPQIPSLVVDCKDAFSELIKFLIEKQHCRRFGLMGVKSNSAEVIERTNIFKEVLQSYNIPLSSVVFWEEDFSYTKAYLAVEKYYQKQKSLDLDAIVCLNDDMAFGCMDFCSQNNIAVPKEVIVTGFDDSERAAFFSPTLTSVNQSLQLQGYKAGESVYSLIQGFDVPIVQEVKANTVLRQSCEKYNVSDLGRSILNEDFTSPEGLRIPNPEQKDAPVSGDYLIEVRDSLFNMDDGAEEIPLTTSKKQDNILDDLEAILKHEAKITENDKYIVKETKGSLFITEKEPRKIRIDESKDEKREIKYRKISLFDEE